MRVAMIIPYMRIEPIFMDSVNCFFVVGRNTGSRGHLSFASSHRCLENESIEPQTSARNISISYVSCIENMQWVCNPGLVETWTMHLHQGGWSLAQRQHAGVPGQHARSIVHRDSVLSLKEGYSPITKTDLEARIMTASAAVLRVVLLARTASVRKERLGR